MHQNYLDLNIAVKNFRIQKAKMQARKIKRRLSVELKKKVIKQSWQIFGEDIRTDKGLQDFNWQDLQELSRVKEMHLRAAI